MRASKICQRQENMASYIFVCKASDDPFYDLMTLQVKLGKLIQYYYHGKIICKSLILKCLLYNIFAEFSGADFAKIHGFPRNFPYYENTQLLWSYTTDTIASLPRCYYAFKPWPATSHVFISAPSVSTTRLCKHPTGRLVR